MGSNRFMVVSEENGIILITIVAKSGNERGA